jgi:penicillin-binding protein 1A
MARGMLLELYPDDAYTNGYKIFTTIDSRLQKTANIALQNGLLSYNKKHGYKGSKHNYPLEIITPDTDILPEEPSNEIPEISTKEGAISDIDLPTLPFSENWIKALKKQPVYGILQPAIVQQVNDRDIAVLLKDNNSQTIDWPGLSWASEYKSINKKGKKPRTAADIVKQGDLVWIYPNEKQQWQLGQVPEAQAALISLNPNNGAIKSLIGGFDFVQSHFNRVTQASRQPGSSFKPFIYSSALANNFTPASIINDAPVVFEDNGLENTWRPENDGGRFYGPTRLRKALYLSRNLVSIRILRQMGLKAAMEHISSFGFDETKLNRDLSLALGGSAVTPMELATGYSTFANGGYKINNYLVSKITDSTDLTLYRHTPLTVCAECPEADATTIETPTASLNENDEASGATITTTIKSNIDETSNQPIAIEKPTYAPRVLPASNAYLITSMLQDVVQKGTARKARALKRNDIAGKTGTTNDQKDAWFAGFNSDYVTVVWVGFDNPTTLGSNAYGGNTALPIWMDFMREALRNKPSHTMKMPLGMINVRIDPTTGLRAQTGQEDAIFETFLKGSEPTEYAAKTVHIESTNGPAPEELF